jgi:peptidoglycan/LPS O-acetylase OafA/YrhL
MNVRATRFPLLDSLRAVAALIILCAHVVAPAGGRDGSLAPYLNRLAVGIAVFFVISAFLLYRPFVRARIDGANRPGVAAYAWGRFLRIVPPFWAALAISTLWLGLGGVFTLRGLPTYFGFGQIYWNDTVLGGIAVAWSLCVEVSFYVFLPLFAAAMWRIPAADRSGRIRSELAVVGALFAASVGWKMLVGWTALHEHSAFVLSLPSYLDWFAAGMALAVVSVWLEHREGQPLPLRVIDRHPGLCWLAALAFFWTVSTQIVPDGGFQRPDDAGYVPEHLFYLLVAVSLFLPAVFGDPARGLLRRRVLANPVLLYLGLISYGIFLWHLPVIEQLKRWDLGSVDVLHPYVVWPAVTLAITAAIATVSWYVLERPALSLKRLVGPRHEPQPREAIAEPAAQQVAAVAGSR